MAVIFVYWIEMVIKAMASNSEKVISYSLPKVENLVCPEATETGADGREEHCEFDTFINWMLRERNTTLALARQMGYGHALLPHELEKIPHPTEVGRVVPNPAYKKITFEQNDVARTYLQQRFTGNSIKQFVTNKLSQTPPLNANDVFKLIDDRYSLVEDCNDPEAVKRRSKQALKALWKAAPMWYAIFNHTQIEWDGQEVTEDTNIRQWLQAVLDEQGAHESLLGHIKKQLTQSDLSQEVETVDRILEKIKTHPHLAFPWLEMHAALLDQCETFHANGACYNPSGKYQNSKVAGYVQTFTYYYEKRAQHRLRLDEAAKNGPIPEINGLKSKSTSDETGGVEVPKNACKYHFYGEGNCRFGDKCKRSHDGVKGSGGPWKTRAELAKKSSQFKKDTKQKSSDDEEPSAFKKRGRRCYICDDPDHIAQDCPERQKKRTKNCFDYQDDDKSVLKKLCTIVKSMAEKKKKNHYKEFLEWKKTQTTEPAARKIAAVVKPESDSENEGPDLNFSDLDDLDDIDELCNTQGEFCSDNSEFQQNCYSIPQISHSCDVILQDLSDLQSAGNSDYSQDKSQYVNFKNKHKLKKPYFCDFPIYGPMPKRISENSQNCRTIGGLTKHYMHATKETIAKIGSEQRLSRISEYPMFDSGAAVNATGNKTLFTNLHRMKTQETIFDAGGHPHLVTHIGDIHVWARTITGYFTVIKFKDIQYVPTLKGFYINTTTLRTKYNWSCEGNQQQIIWIDPLGNKFKLKVFRGNEWLVCSPLNKDKLQQYEQFPTINGFVAESFIDKLNRMSLDDVSSMVEQENNLSQWEILESRIKLAKAGRYVHTSERDPLLALHHELGHVHWRVVAKYAKEHQIPLPHVAKVFCMACMKAKQKKTKRGKEIDKLVKAITRPEPYTKWSADIFGPVKGEDSNNIKYQLMFIDNGSQTIKSYPLNDLRNIPDAVATWVHEIREELKEMNIDKLEVNFSEGIKLRTDSAQYWKSAKMKDILQREQIYISFSAPNTQ